MIDEYPILAVAAAFASGRTVMRGLAELRVKESDRLAAIAHGLAACGVSVDDRGRRSRSSRAHGGPPRGGAPIETQLDHRIAMAFLIFGWRRASRSRSTTARTIATSFPDFVALMNGSAAHSPRRGARRAVRRRDRRAGGVGQGHAGAPPRRAFRFRPSRYRPALSGDGAPSRSRRRPRRSGRGRGGGAAVDPPTSPTRACATRRSREPLRWSPRIPAVRAALLHCSAISPPTRPAGKAGAVLDGRDIGTVVCPDAAVKLSSPPAPRSARGGGLKELRESGAEAIYGASCRI